MRDCRTTQSPKMRVQCTDCDHRMYVPHSCGHRNCPYCQAHESQQWLERQLKKQVPADYFLVTFTIPAEFRALAWKHRKTFFDLMLRCSWSTLKTFSQNDKQLQGVPGAIAVLHTHSRRLDFHPHVHACLPVRCTQTGRDTGPEPLMKRNGFGEPRRVRKHFCSNTRHWPRCFAPECWKQSHKRNYPCLKSILKNGWWIVNMWEPVRRR